MKHVRVGSILWALRPDAGAHTQMREACDQALMGEAADHALLGDAGKHAMLGGAGNYARLER